MNDIFEKLVGGKEPDSADQLIGFMAYGAYRLEKEQWLKEFQEKNQKPAKQEEIDNYFLLTWHQKIAQVQDNARETLDDFFEMYLSDEIDRIKQIAVQDQLVEDFEATGDQLRNDLKQREDQIVKSVKDSWLKKLGNSIFASLIASMIYVALIAGILGVVSWQKPDAGISKVVGSFFTKEKIHVFTQSEFEKLGVTPSGSE